MQEMFSMYIKIRTQISFIKLYIEFEQSEADRNIEREDYNIDSGKKFESNYEIVGPDGDEDQGNDTMEANVIDVANVLGNEHPFEEPSFMRTFNLEAMHAPEFPKYMNADGEFAVEMKFSSKKTVIIVMKDYTIRRGVDYRVYESELLTFYAKIFEDGSRGHTTMNLVECINSVFKGACNFPITALVKATFYMFNELFTRKRAEAEAWINAGHVFSNLVTSKLHANQLPSRNIQVNYFAGRMKYLKCVRCQVEWSMPLTSVDNDVTVASSRLTEFHVDMCLHILQING
ncbi:hypothetical protein Ahy_B03g066363 [Arachis hypogaea]|uniref:Transposase MuDR plant domain-containing protein n=1 Tax=Arachis hypogaea TaxID=3818 RepID=A0A445A3V2_ARAHY|nr:hypothetical protein Ahy_B03g066363 [Arachis hypogaea]